MAGPPKESTFPDKLRMLRKEAGYTQKELSRHCGLAENTVGNIERRDVDPLLGTVMKIMEGLGYNMFFEKTEVSQLQVD